MKKMNNLTKTEALPKTGHVNEVCKEWLVREDSALAYKLQSQEITDFYKGNRFRNAVVREDFPTALNEQIKEQENAEKQQEMYRRRLMEQEEHDKHVAKEIAEKLERDLQEQQQREFVESEIIAQQMQEIYVNLPPVPPPAARDKARPPPRPAKASTLQQHQQQQQQQQSLFTEPSTSSSRFNDINSSNHHQNQPHHHHHHHYRHYHQQQLQPEQALDLQEEQEDFSDTNGYVSLSLATAVPAAAAATTADHSVAHQRHQRVQQPPNRLLVSDGSEVPTAAAVTTAAATNNTTNLLTQQQHQHQQTFNQFVERSKVGRTPPALTNDNFTTQQQFYQHHRHQHTASAISATSATSTSSSTSSSSTSSSSAAAAAAAARRNVFDLITNNTAALIPPQTPSHNTSHSPHTPSKIAPNTLSTSTISQQSSVEHSTLDDLIEYSDVADCIRHYDITNTNTTGTKTTLPSIDATDSSPLKFNKMLSPSHENLLRNDQKFQKLSPEKYDQLVGNNASGGCIAPQTSGTATAVERHMQEHADDIELYVDPCDYASLKEIGLPMEEIKEMSKKLKQEQKDALLARRLQEMEANDGLTQEERDRLLAIEAQDKELAKMLQDREKAKAKRAKEKARLRKSTQKEQGSLCSMSNSLHCGPLLPLPQDCMSLSKSSSSTNTNASSVPSVQQEQLDVIDLEAYSNPIDVIHHQRQHNGTLTNGSLTRDPPNNINVRHATNALSRDDDIYTLPVDSCRPGQRPASLNIGPDNFNTGSGSGSSHHLQLNSMTRSENYSLESHDSLLSNHDISPRMNYTKSGPFDQNSSPTPPYMPIQGTRRSNSSEDRKKKSKDKCTHQ